MACLSLTQSSTAGSAIVSTAIGFEGVGEGGCMDEHSRGWMEFVFLFGLVFNDFKIPQKALE